MIPTGNGSTLDMWVYNMHEDVWREYRNDSGYSFMSDYLKAKHPEIWVEWRMRQ